MSRRVSLCGLIVVISGVIMVGCSRTPVNGLQDAVNAFNPSAQNQFGKNWAGHIKMQDVRGKWAFVITRRRSGVGVGRCAVVRTKDGPKWKIASFSFYSLHKTKLKLVWAKVDGSLSGKLKESLRDEWKSKWDQYLTSEGLVMHALPCCQSCIMLMDKPELYGTTANGGKSKDYCSQCFQNGKFTEPDITMQEMIEKRVEQIVNKYGVREELARRSLADEIPTAKRWETD